MEGGVWRREAEMGTISSVQGVRYQYNVLKATAHYTDP